MSERTSQPCLTQQVKLIEPMKIFTLPLVNFVRLKV